MIHELKILPKWFEDVIQQKKTFEIRKNDRNYSVGDTLILKEWNKGKYTGREVKRTVSYIYYGDGTYGLSEEYVVMAIRNIPMKVNVEKWIHTKCPSGCGYELSTHHKDGYYSIDNKPTFCPNCGQALLWEESEVEE